MLFLPASERLNPSEHTLFSALFRLGFFGFSIMLIDTDDSIDALVRQKLIDLGRPIMAKRYVCVLAVGNTHWIWYSSDNVTEAEYEWKTVLTNLKKGEEIIFQDYGEPKQRSIRLSWHGLDIEW